MSTGLWEMRSHLLCVQELNMATERNAQFIPEVSRMQEVSYRPLVQRSEAPPLTSASSNANGIFRGAAAKCRCQ
jgi:hypothetical protein